MVIHGDLIFVNPTQHCALEDLAKEQLFCAKSEEEIQKSRNLLNRLISKENNIVVKE